MEMEQRIEVLEAEVEMLRNEIQNTLVDIRESLPEKPVAPSRWQKKAWVLALLNLLMAITLFTNIYLYIPGNPLSEISPSLASWLRSLWVAVAFIWLILQMYPVALLLEQEDRQYQGIVWRNALSFIEARPGLLIGATTVVLVIAIVNAVFPAAWLIVTLTLLVAVASVMVRQIFGQRHKQA